MNKFIRTEVRSFYSRRLGWIARKVFYTNGSTHYAVTSGKVGYLSKQSADAKAKELTWKRN